MTSWVPEMGASCERLDAKYESEHLPDAERRADVFSSAARILAHGPPPSGGADQVTGLALGYVQSGKTTSFTALTALASDNGYRLIIALLGSTDLLLDQNRRRLEEDLELRDRGDYRWIHLHKPQDSQDQATQIDRYLAQDRTVLITILKNAAQVGRTARLLGHSASARGVHALIIDDEADQISLNTRVRDDEVSRTYEEINRLRDRLGPLLYAQYTATPFAPLLVEARDVLSPTFVEVLEPGPEYTGGEAFFLERRGTVVRRVPDHEAEEDDPSQVPYGLRSAIASFCAGAALMLGNGTSDGPISMLVHVSHLTVVHARFKDMVELLVRTWATKLGRDEGDPGRRAVLDELIQARNDLIAHGADDIADDAFESKVRWVLEAAEVWMVNSLSDMKEVEWPRSPVHLLIGGNKLDRGFTVRGLTVTYMTRRATGGQADTIEQRARAFGYKRSYLEYCRFYAPANVNDAFTTLVHTEASMRASLLEWAAAGLPLGRWAEDVGLILPGDLRPTRSSVIFEPDRFRGTGWHTLRKPDLDDDACTANRKTIDELGLFGAPTEPYGQLHHRRLDDQDLLDVLERWSVDASPGWEHELILEYCRRRSEAGALPPSPVLLLEAPTGEPRDRGWDPTNGVPNLMQGRDDGTGYPGDRYIHEDRPMLQVHRIRPRGSQLDEVLTLALYLPEDPRFPSSIVRRAGWT